LPPALVDGLKRNIRSALFDFNAIWYDQYVQGDFLLFSFGQNEKWTSLDALEKQKFNVIKIDALRFFVQISGT